MSKLPTVTFSLEDGRSRDDLIALLKSFGVEAPGFKFVYIGSDLHVICDSQKDHHQALAARLTWS